jgi:hypothetical protein
MSGCLRQASDTFNGGNQCRSDASGAFGLCNGKPEYLDAPEEDLKMRVADGMVSCCGYKREDLIIKLVSRCGSVPGKLGLRWEFSPRSAM